MDWDGVAIGFSIAFCEAYHAQQLEDHLHELLAAHTGNDDVA